MDVREIGALVAKYGQTVALRRYTGNSGAFYEVMVKAQVRLYQPNELVGPVQQGDRQVTMGTAEMAARQWPAPPQRGDRMIIDGKTVTVEANPESRNLGEDTAFYVMRVRG